MIEPLTQCFQSVLTCYTVDDQQCGWSELITNWVNITRRSDTCGPSAIDYTFGERSVQPVMGLGGRCFPYSYFDCWFFFSFFTQSEIVGWNSIQEIRYKNFRGNCISSKPLKPLAHFHSTSSIHTWPTSTLDHFFLRRNESDVLWIKMKICYQLSKQRRPASTLRINMSGFLPERRQNNKLISYWSVTFNLYKTNNHPAIEDTVLSNKCTHRNKTLSACTDPKFCYIARTELDCVSLTFNISWRRGVYWRRRFYVWATNSRSNRSQSAALT